MTSNPVTNLLLVNFKEKLQINSLKTSIMEDKTIKVKAKTGTEVKMDKIGMEDNMDLMGKGRDGQEII